MPIPPEAIEGFLMQAGLKYVSQDQGANGQFIVTFATKRYVNPVGEKVLGLILTIGEEGRYLEITAVQMYSANDAKDVGKIAEFLLGENHQQKLIRWELDRSDNEIRATAEVAPCDGSITFDAFMRMLMVFPCTADRLHPAITKVMTTAELPSPMVTDRRVSDLVRRAGGIKALEKLVRAAEKSRRDATRLTKEVAEKFGIHDAPGDVEQPSSANPISPPTFVPPADEAAGKVVDGKTLPLKTNCPATEGTSRTAGDEAPAPDGAPRDE